MNTLYPLPFKMQVWECTLIGNGYKYAGVSLANTVKLPSQCVLLFFIGIASIITIVIECSAIMSGWLFFLFFNLLFELF